MKNAIVGCEYSGIVRDALRARGVNAVSCDLLPSERPGPHYQGDVRDLLVGHGGRALRTRFGIERVDLGIFHPPCTFLANSGVRWLHERPARWAKLDEAAALFRTLLESPVVPRVCVENPVPHKYALERIGSRYAQTVQPWQFGHGETKRTCLWLRNLPTLEPTNVVEGREARVHRMPPGPERQKERSRFFEGIAAAMADQWVPLL